MDLGLGAAAGASVVAYQLQSDLGSPLLWVALVLSTLATFRWALLLTKLVRSRSGGTAWGAWMVSGVSGPGMLLMSVFFLQVNQLLDGMLLAL